MNYNLQNKMSHTNRVILLIDMDCFYCQVEENLDSDLKGKPLAVVQYNQWRGGGIIAVNYPARDKGVTRFMRGDDAKEKCPEILLVKVPEVRGKADLSKYRDAGKKVAAVLQTFTPLLERASVDEAYLDITNVIEKRIQDKRDQITVDKLLNTFVVGNSTVDFVENVTRHKEYDESNYKLALGGIIAEEIREQVFKVTGYECSAGIAHNKILAKLVCGLHKPNKQTILPHEAVPLYYENLPVRKIRSLGGKFGKTVVGKLGIENMGELAKFGQRELVKKFDEKTACWLYNIARGIDTEPVNTRLVSKSIGCCKKFPGKTTLCRKEDIEHWVNELADEIFERLEQDLEENGRKPRQMVVSFANEIGNEETHGSKSYPLNSYQQKRIFENAFQIVQKNCMRDDGGYRVTFLGISVGNFQDVKKIKEITSFFKKIREKVDKEEPLQNITNDNNILIINDNNIAPIEKQKDEFSNYKIETSNNSKSMDNIEDTSDGSIYSCKTEEGDTSNGNLIYYEQVHPKSIIANQNFTLNDSESLETDKDSDVSHDSISSEFNNCEDKQYVNPNDTNIAPANSFFSKYFSGNSKRNFNTSKIIEDSNDLSDSSEDLNDNVDDKNSESNNSKIESNETVQVDIAENTNNVIDIICPQCGKTVNNIDYQSHLDYHFSLSIVKNEAHLYKIEANKTASTSRSSVTPVKTGNRNKRKHATNLHKPIGDYFKSGLIKGVQDEAKDLCGECNKQIALTDWEVHMDYHTAKKLHLEMNVNIGKPIQQKTVKAKFKGQKNLKEFLKSS